MNETVSFNRMPRIQEALPQSEVKIPAPPTISPLSKFSWFQTLLPLGGVLMMVGMYGGLRGDWTMAIMMAAMSGFSVVGSIVGKQMQRKNHKKQVEESEAAYKAALDQKRAELEHLRLEQQRVRADTDPELAILLARARNRDSRLWERRPADADFLHVRLGVGDLPSTVIVSAPHPDMPDPHLKEAHTIEAEYARVPQVPVLADVRRGPLGIAGPLPERNGIARAMICNLVIHHSPDEVHLLAIYSPHRTLEWQWLKWLPHTYTLNDKTGRHYLANDSLSAGDVLKGLLDELHRRQNQLYAAQQEQNTPAWPWLVLFVEDYALVRNDPAIHLLLSPQGRQLNVTALFAVNQPSQVPTGCSTVVESQPDGQLRYSIAGAAGETFSCWPEYADVTLSEQLTRSLAPVEVYTLQSDSDMPSNVRLLDMLSIKDISRYNVAGKWQNRSLDQYLKVPIGERRGNQPLVLDLSHTGHGPHGLIAGTTGSGKSELVQTLVVGLALTHHPYDVGFILVDFKGGGTFADLVSLPHTLGMVTDLSGNLTERALIALGAEMDRRKRLFNAAGVNDIGPYQDLYWQHKVKDPLPRLVVIVDEFAELVTDYPDFMDGLSSIARVGRTLGVHLILATQSPAGVVKQQIWANAKFRICLRVESRQESQEMLHRQEAANLPRTPGRGYLQVGNNDVFELFQVARVAGRYNVAGNTGALQLEKRVVISEVSSLGRRNMLFDSHKARQSQAKAAEPTDIDAVVPRLVAEAKQMGLKQLPSPWPDPLPEHVALPELLLQNKYAGWNGVDWVFDRAALTSPAVPARFCRTCGASLRAGAKFCPNCRTPVRNRCSQCGSLLKPGAKFCPACGNVITVVAAPKPTTPLAPRPPSLPNRPWLGATMGLLDDPAHQRQIPMLLELDRQDGQLITIGASGSGKGMWVRTLIMSLARTHTPDELYFYLFEFSGQALDIFRNLPHVGGVFTPLDNERVKRLLRLLLDALEERKQQCNQARVDGLVRLRELQPDQSPPAIVVVITGFVEFRNMFQDELFQLISLIREGGPYGIHIVLLGNRAGDIPSTISSVVARRVVLRLAAADEYSLVLGARLKPSKEQKFPSGRGWYGRPPLEFQTATPGHEEAENAQLT
ncbi:MAG: FtsK/SpoIIIE domain-containing protein, partial [Chloroflexota bacterium]|nr:FtsK/SpoIIIE domain-containing protein [Chloroflexota bacterium]